jgi:hypothetical protein
MSTIHVNSKPALHMPCCVYVPHRGYLGVLEFNTSLQPVQHVGRNRPIIAHRDLHNLLGTIGPMLVERTGGVLNLTHFLISSGIIAIDQAAVPMPCLKWGSFNASYAGCFTIVACV